MPQISPISWITVLLIVTTAILAIVQTTNTSNTPYADSKVVNTSPQNNSW